MEVGELIKELEKYPMNAPVFISLLCGYLDCDEYEEEICSVGVSHGDQGGVYLELED